MLVVLSVIIFSLLIGSAFIETNEYVSGQAVITVSRLDHARSQTRGVVEGLHATPGDSLQAGQELGRVVPLGAEPNRRAALTAYERALVSMLRAPQRDELRDAVREHRQQITAAAPTLFPEPIVAPEAGTVSSTRVRNGELVDAGDILLSSSSGESQSTAVASFPAHAQPYIRPGARFRVSFPGTSRKYWWFVAERVERGALREGASRTVGSDTVSDDDRAWVRVYGTLLSEEEEGSLRDGMIGNAELVIRRRSVFRRFFSAFERPDEE